jgi:uncharacterized coiled-coil DUF342 family protein
LQRSIKQMRRRHNDLKLTIVSRPLSPEAEQEFNNAFQQLIEMIVEKEVQTRMSNERRLEGQASDHRGPMQH